MKDKYIIDKLMQTPNVKNLGLKEESVLGILKAFENIALETLLERGKLEYENIGSLEIVQLIDRVHVLRGIRYPANRKYKLKVTMEDNLYNHIEEYYDKLREEIL